MVLVVVVVLVVLVLVVVLARGGGDGYLNLCRSRKGLHKSRLIPHVHVFARKFVVVLFKSG